MTISEPHWLHSFIVGDLCNKIIKDIYNYKIFNEADLQSKVYYHLYYRIKREEKHDNLLILNKPTIYSKKGDTKYPDLVICKTHTYKSPEPIVAIELKFNLQKFPDYQKDIEKLKTIKKDFSTIRKGYFFFVYDDDEIWEHTRMDNWMKHYFFVASINVRKRKESGRHRDDYEDWKQSFETVSFGR